MKKRLGKLQFNADANEYSGSCRLDGNEVGVRLASEGSVDVKTLPPLAERILSRWPTLHRELCEIARAEIISSEVRDFG